MCEVYPVDDIWISLSSPSQGGSFRNLVKIDNDRFVLQQGGYIEIFNTKQNDWTKYESEIDQYMFAYEGEPIAYNSNTGTIYAAGQEKITMMDIQGVIKQKSNFEEYESKDVFHSAVIFVDDTLHIIGGVCYEEDKNRFYSHHIWDQGSKSTKLIHKFPDIKGNFSGMGLVHAPKRNELILLSGFDYGRQDNQWRLDEIYTYSVSKQEWRKLDNIRLPHTMNNFGCVITKDERYIICCAGLNDGEGPSYKDIFVVDLQLMKIFQVDMKFPHNRICRAIIMSDDEKNDLLSHGFIRHEIKKHGIDIPFEIIELLCIWNSIEYLHVMNEQGKHWKINVDDVINRIIH